MFKNHWGEMAKSKVVLVSCSSYDEELLDSALKRGIELLGGIKRFASPSEKLLLKPNVLWGTDPARCVVTHPSVFKSVAKLFKSRVSELNYGDSPGGFQPAINALKKSGHAAVADELGLKLADFDHGRYVSHPKGLSSKKLYIANGVLECDGLVSIPKLKSHGLTRLTGAVKNQYGCVPGATKGEYHAKFPDVLEFSKILVDVCQVVKPRLYIMDAIIAMEGNGPRSGDPKKLGLLLLSTDPVALDAVASRIVDLNPEFVPTSLPGKEIGLGTYLQDEIELLGDSIEEFIDKRFKIVRKPVESMPGTVFLKGLKRLVTPRPVIITHSCTRCGRCIQVCPVDPKAVMWRSKRGRKRPPVYNYRDCIRCYCCHEMCPSRAIKIRKPLLGKMIPFLSYISLFMSGRFMKKRR
ncbi:DUF362 domain-containing protein [Chitinispirillales bacterium ANBcel5]|uniref:DUF362 domain-containing protein n=1 Tax=Cellulosispirillum alkaliphilum TaxID=3039283 RepID=UPI002A5348A3|nr:DUF362 domain-containing protein [Chitinispirillales bacterium ANBcel5]